MLTIVISPLPISKFYRLKFLFRKPLCNGNGKASAKCPEVGADEDSGTPSGSLTPANDAQTPSINETPLSLRRVSTSKPLPDLSAAAIKATVAVAAAAAAAEKGLNPRFQDQVNEYDSFFILLTSGGSSQNCSSRGSSKLF